MNYFPTINPDTKIFNYPQNEILIKLSKKESKEKSTISITNDAWAVLKYCDGTNDFVTILNKLKAEYDLTEEYLSKFFNEMNANNLISLNSHYTKSKFYIYGDGEKYFPRHISFRITEKCNLKCSYCYMGKPDSKIPFTNYSQLEKILETLKNNHVTTLEITGGEPIIHPDFDKVIQYAINNFEFLTILTNGVYFPEKIIKYISTLRDKIFIQISIDGSNEEVSYLIRKVKGTDTKTIKTIKKMLQNNIPFRVAMVVTFENVKDIENIILKLKRVGVNDIVLTFSEELGNAIQNDSNSKTIFLKIVEEHGKYIGEIIKKYSDIVNVQLSDISKYLSLNSGNCGAGSRSAVVNHLGDVYPCVMLNEESSKMGNILSDDYLDIFNISKISKICRNFNLKSTVEPFCKGCEYSSYCSSCFTKVYIANKKRLSKKLSVCEIASKFNITELLQL